MSQLKVIFNGESRNLQINTGSGTSRFAELDDGRLMICSAEDNVIYDPETGNSTDLKEFEGKGEIGAVCKIDNEYYLGSLGGLIFKWTPGRLEEFGRISGAISSMAVSSDKTIWIGATGGGLWKVKTAEKTINKVLNEDITCMCFRTSDELWIGSNTGLMIYEISSGHTSRIKSNPVLPNALPHYSIRHIIRDREGGMWIATQYGGICYWNPRQTQVTSLKMGMDESHLNDAVSGQILEDRQGRILIGTNNGGINIYNPETGITKHHLLSRLPGNNDIKAIVELGNGKFLVGCYKSGLNMFDSRTGSFFHLNAPANIFNIVEEGDGSYLCGNYDGLYRFNLPLNSYYKVSNLTSGILYKDSKGRLWQGGCIGFTVSDSLHFDLPYVKTIYECRDGRFLLGCDNGLYSSDGDLKHFDALSVPGLPAGLPINGIEQDRSGRFWLGTTNGLYMVDRDFCRCMHFSEADGLATNYFYNKSHCVLKSGDLCFGGLGGVSIFNPDSLSATSLCPPPVISSIKIHGEEFTPGGEGKIVFKHSQNNLSFTFSVPDYISEGNNIFRYRLNGFDSRWYYPSSRSVNYSNLPKGRYSLLVECSRNGNLWTPMAAPLEFRVKPVWFLSTLAIILEILLLAACIWGILAISAHQKEIKNRLEIQKLEEKHAKEISRLKALKFINSSLRGETVTGNIITSLKEKDERFIVMAMSIVENNLSNADFDTDNLAKQMNMSRMTLYKEMKRITGDTALVFIHKLRFTEACRLLRESNKTVSEISYITGFSSPVYFSERFKKTFGCTPKEYSRSKN